MSRLSYTRAISREVLDEVVVVLSLHREKMEAMSLESVIEGFQECVEKENQPVNEEAFHVSEEEVKGLKEEMKKEEEEEWEEKEYYMTREDFEKLKNPDGTITINGENLVIEGISDVKEGEIKDEEVPFVEVKKCVCLFDTEFESHN